MPRRWAAGALVAIAALLGLRAVEHARAISLASAESVDVPQELGQATTLQVLSPLRVLSSPDPFSLFRWHAAVDFGPFLQLEEIDSARGLVTPVDEHLDKPARSAALEAAFASPLGRAYLDWSPMPALSVSNGSAEDAPAAESAGSTVVIFRDPRFMGTVPLLDRGGTPPLTGTVELDPQNRVLGQTMDGREQPVR